MYAELPDKKTAYPEPDAGAAPLNVTAAALLLATAEVNETDVVAAESNDVSSVTLRLDESIAVGFDRIVTGKNISPFALAAPPTIRAIPAMRCPLAVVAE